MKYRHTREQIAKKLDNWYMETDYKHAKMVISDLLEKSPEKNNLERCACGAFIDDPDNYCHLCKNIKAIRVPKYPEKEGEIKLDNVAGIPDGTNIIICKKGKYYQGCVKPHPTEQHLIEPLEPTLYNFDPNEETHRNKINELTTAYNTLIKLVKSK